MPADVVPDKGRFLVRPTNPLKGGEEREDHRAYTIVAQRAPEVIKMERAQLRLSKAQPSKWYRIAELDGPETECRRLLDLGFTPAEPVAVVRSTPLGDPIIVVVRGTQLALRKREAAWILVR